MFDILYIQFKKTGVTLYTLLDDLLYINIIIIYTTAVILTAPKCFSTSVLV